MAIAVFFRGARAAPPRGRRGGPGRLPPAQTGSQRKQPPPARRGHRGGGTPASPPKTRAFAPQNTRFSLRNSCFPPSSPPPKQPGEAAPRPSRHYSGSAGCEARESGGVWERDKNLIMQRTFLIDYCRVQGWGNAGCQQPGREAEGRAGCGRSLPRAPRHHFFTIREENFDIDHVIFFFFSHRRIYLGGYRRAGTSFSAYLEYKGLLSVL